LSSREANHLLAYRAYFNCTLRRETMIKANQGNADWLHTKIVLTSLCVVGHISRLVPSPSLDIHYVSAVYVKLQWNLGQFGDNFA
jgi:hypothetical protein